jgi:biopolymer transport protein ExbD
MGTFNMTPIIDIVFLLIIFFMVICRFIEAENFPVTVPDDCNFAADRENDAGETTITVMKTADDKSSFAVGSEKITDSTYSKVAERIAELINIHLKNLPEDRRIVTLRIDKDVCFSHAQYALAGVAASNAKDIQLAILREKRPPAE